MVSNSDFAPCPECGQRVRFDPLTRRIDEKRRVLILTYNCPNGHIFTIEIPLK